MAEYPANSHRSKELATEGRSEERKVQKVVSGKVTTKKNEVRKLTDIFISEDARNVKSYIFMDVLVPAIKKAISDIVTDGIDMILYGGSGSGRKTKPSNNVSYRNYYESPRNSMSSRNEPQRSRFDYDDIVFESRGEAELVREQMVDMIERYGFVTVADMYDMADLTSPYTSNKYGWTNIRSAEAVRVRDGYILKLPKAMPID